MSRPCQGVCLVWNPLIYFNKFTYGLVLRMPTEYGSQIFNLSNATFIHMLKNDTVIVAT